MRAQHIRLRCTNMPRHRHRGTRHTAVSSAPPTPSSRNAQHSHDLDTRSIAWRAAASRAAVGICWAFRHRARTRMTARQMSRKPDAGDGKHKDGRRRRASSSASRSQRLVGMATWFVPRACGGSRHEGTLHNKARNNSIHNTRVPRPECVELANSPPPPRSTHDAATLWCLVVAHARALCRFGVC